MLARRALLNTQMNRPHLQPFAPSVAGEVFRDIVRTTEDSLNPPILMLLAKYFVTVVGMRKAPKSLISEWLEFLKHQFSRHFCENRNPSTGYSAPQMDSHLRGNDA